jgi:hypothetical protein
MDHWIPREAHLVNRFSIWNVQTGLFPTGNRQATSSTAAEARSESAIAINPLNPSNMVGASKKFIDPSIYLFKLGPIYTFDAGRTWHESTLPMHPGWDGMTDPTLAFDAFGNAFLVGEPLTFDMAKAHTPRDITGHGMYVYRSSDGGKTWSQPMPLTTDTTDDKQWVICDNNPSSPHYGNVYVVWAAWSPLRFARSTDHGATWRGKGQDSPGTSLVSLAFAPELSVSPDGALHILWHTDNGTTVQYLRSTDGGETFSQIRTVVQGVVSLRGNLPIMNGWPHFDDGKFRVLTLATSCIGAGDVLVVAWADMREGRSRIYYRRSTDGGTTWEGPASGRPLLPQVTYGDTHCFHPQIVATKTGVIGCAFYTFGPKPGGKHLIDVQLAASWDDGASFPWFITVTDHPWDPLLDAPKSHGDPEVDFIGEYFGLDADEEDFALLWTDTRTGVQELFSDVVRTKRITSPHIPELVGDILFGITQDGGGVLIVGGKIIPVPPREPLIAALEALADLDGASEEDVAEKRDEAVAALRAAAEAIAERG